MKVVGGQPSSRSTNTQRKAHSRQQLQVTDTIRRDTSTPDVALGQTIEDGVAACRASRDGDPLAVDQAFAGAVLDGLDRVGHLKAREGEDADQL